MSTHEEDYLHPDDVPYLIELRQDLSDAFRAARRRYELNGLGEEESRQHACDFARSVLKKVTLDINPRPEPASVREFCDYLMQQRPKVLWTLISMLIAMIVAVFSLGVFVGSH